MIQEIAITNDSDPREVSVFVEEMEVITLVWKKLPLHRLERRRKGMETTFQFVRRPSLKCFRCHRLCLEAAITVITKENFRKKIR